MARLTRKEKQAHTRSCLMKSAAKVFARRGLQHASIDEVAEDAGFTKGAFYANFRSKEELFLAMLDQRFAERIEEIDRVMETHAEPAQQARQIAADFLRYLGADPDWQRIFFEFTAYAARNDPFREELVTRYKTLRTRIADAYRQKQEELGVTLPVPVEQIALMTFAMANGIALEKLLEPEAVSDELYATMLTAFFEGLRAMAESSEPAVTS
jgi:AcrR family transcriptional regulator